MECEANAAMRSSWVRTKRMQYTRERSVFVVIILTCVFAAALASSFAVGITRAEAQTRVVGGVEVQVPRDPVSPFGYGGGPRDPNPPNLAPRLQGIFERFLGVFRSFFG